jgi:hypothetical protein
VDAAVALPALRSVSFCYMAWPPAPLRALARLLRGAGGGAGLHSFTVRLVGIFPGDDFLTGDDVAELCDAIQAATQLSTLQFFFTCRSDDTQQFRDAAAGAAIMAAAHGHPTLRAITINNATLPT